MPAPPAAKGGWEPNLGFHAATIEGKENECRALPQKVRQPTTRERRNYARKRTVEEMMADAPSAHEVLQYAEREGIVLERASNQSGYAHVVCGSAKLPFSVPKGPRGPNGGKRKSLGSFATAEEAALTYALAERAATRRGG